MKLELDEQIISEAMQETSTEAIKSALGDYTIKRKIQESVADSLITNALEKAVTQATSNIDVDRIASTLSVEIASTLQKAVIMLLQDAVTEVVAKIRGCQYDTKKVALLRNELFGEKE